MNDCSIIFDIAPKFTSLTIFFI